MRIEIRVKVDINGSTPRNEWRLENTDGQARVHGMNRQVMKKEISPEQYTVDWSPDKARHKMSALRHW